MNMLNTSDFYDETQGQVHDLDLFFKVTGYSIIIAVIHTYDGTQVQRWTILTYFSRSQRLIKEKVWHHDISTLQFVLLPY